jgi:hypothetical protein
MANSTSPIGGNVLSTSRKKRTKEWTIIVSVVIGLHVLLFLSVRPAFFSMFKKTVTSASEGDEGRPFAPRAILTIPIEIEDYPSDQEQEVVQEAIEPVPRERRKLDAPMTILEEITEDNEGEESNAPLDVEKLLGESPQTLPHNIGREKIMIPPRALEITWPDTRALKHCLGHHIDMKIHVDATGAIVSIQPLDMNHPSDCIEAAVESASEIVFEPGRVDGVATPMWTHVRIDFRKKK